MTNKKILTLISFLLLFSFLLAGCMLPKQNLPPVITSDPVETATVGIDYTYNVVAADPNAGDVLTYSLTTEPPGMLINPDSGVITWKADDITAAGVGDYDVVVVVSDGKLSDTQDFTIKVSEFVVELIKIEVDPEEMTLHLYGGLNTGTFVVTADYNDGTDKVVTTACVYGIDDISIAKVEAGKVTALEEVGTATVSISYTEGGITRGTTLTVIVKKTIAIRWLEDAVRCHPDGETIENGIWFDDPTPALEPGVPAQYPATLIVTDGGYYFADVNEYYNNAGITFEGSVVIDETGLLSGNTTYYLYGLPTENDFAGQVEIIIYEEAAEYGEVPFDGTMVGTYTQLKYAYGTEAEVTKYYQFAEKCADSEIKWFVQYTEYIAHEWEWE